MLDGGGPSASTCGASLAIDSTYAAPNNEIVVVFEALQGCQILTNDIVAIADPVEAFLYPITVLGATGTPTSSSFAVQLNGSQFVSAVTTGSLLEYGPATSLVSAPSGVASANGYTEVAFGTSPWSTSPTATQLLYTTTEADASDWVQQQGALGNASFGEIQAMKTALAQSAEAYPASQPTQRLDSCNFWALWFQAVAQAAKLVNLGGPICLTVPGTGNHTYLTSELPAGSTGSNMAYQDFVAFQPLNSAPFVLEFSDGSNSVANDPPQIRD